METQKINIAEILKDCPKLTALYSPMYGSVLFEEVDLENNRIRVSCGLISNIVLYKDGKFAEDGECMLFPSYDQRDWSKFKKTIVPPFSINRDSDEYYCFTMFGDVELSPNEHRRSDDALWDFGNHFDTREQAEYAAQKVKELLLSLRKEQK